TAVSGCSSARSPTPRCARWRWDVTASKASRHETSCVNPKARAERRAAAKPAGHPFGGSADVPPIGRGAEMSTLPTRFEDVEALEDFMSEPTPGLVADLARVDGDIIVIGVGGKMGPTLARMAKRAAPGKRVIGVARFSNAPSKAMLEAHGVECVACDLL